MPIDKVMLYLLAFFCLTTPLYIKYFVYILFCNFLFCKIKFFIFIWHFFCCKKSCIFVQNF
jgi:hypothetical protein